MRPADSDPIPSPNSIGVPSGEAVDSPAVSRRPARLWASTLGAGVIAGMVAWLGGEACLDLIKPSRHEVNSRGLILKLADRRQQAAADAENAGLAFAILGAALGAGLGTAGGLARGSGRAAAKAALLGLVVGSVGGP